MNAINWTLKVKRFPHKAGGARYQVDLHDSKAHLYTSATFTIKHTAGQNLILVDGDTIGRLSGTETAALTHTIAHILTNFERGQTTL